MDEIVLIELKMEISEPQRLYRSLYHLFKFWDFTLFLTVDKGLGKGQGVNDCWITPISGINFQITYETQQD